MFKHNFKHKYKAPAATVIIAVTIAAALFLMPGCSSGPEKDYNVVLIVIDTLRSDHLPFYGYEKNTAPFMTELANKGTVFENAFSTSSWTSPATASIHTSLYPYQHGVLMGLLAIRNAQKIDPNVKINRIPPKAKTIAEMLKENGYKTYGAADNLNIDKRQGFTQGFDKFRTYMYRQAPNLNNTVKNWHKKITSGGKYFLYLHYMEPHAPYHARAPWFKQYGGKLPEDYTKEELDAQTKEDTRNERRKNRIAAYDSEINFVDQHIKELYDTFKWDKNTVIIITSDHGEGLWDHGLMAHGHTLYREEIQVPLLIILPDEKGNKRITTNVSTIDILPTIRDYLGLKNDSHHEGTNLIPLINNDESTKEKLEKRNIFAHLWVQTKQKEWNSTVYKKWHYILRKPDAHFLFFLNSDPNEQNNKFAEGQKIALKLKTIHDNFQKTCKKLKQITSTLKLNKKESNKLKTLGYVQ